MGRVIDMTGAGDFAPAPAGEGYVVELTKTDWEPIKNGKNKGVDQARCTYTITNEVSPADGTPVAGKKCFRNYPMLPQTRFIFLGDMIALGYPEEDLQGEVDWEAVLVAMNGRKAITNLTISKYTYPEGHPKVGQTRESNEMSPLQAIEYPEILEPAGSSRRRG